MVLINHEVTNGVMVMSQLLDFYYFEKQSKDKSVKLNRSGTSLFVLQSVSLEPKRSIITVHLAKHQQDYFPFQQMQFERGIEIPMKCGSNKLSSKPSLITLAYTPKMEEIANLLFLYFDTQPEIFTVRHAVDLLTEMAIRKNSTLLNQHFEYLRLLSYMLENMGQPLSSEELCRHMNMSFTSLNKLTRENAQKSPMQLLSQLKHHEAKNLLQTTQKPISELANDLGFKSIHHFSNFFKKQEGTTPSEYRKRLIYDRYFNDDQRG